MICTSNIVEIYHKDFVLQTVLDLEIVLDTKFAKYIEKHFDDGKKNIFLNSLRSEPRLCTEMIFVRCLQKCVYKLFTRVIFNIMVTDQGKTVTKRCIHQYFVKEKFIMYFA